MEKRMGRPPVRKDDQLSEIIQFRLTSTERRQCEETAGREEIRFSAWIRECVVRASRRKPKAQ
jgi:hypothetical protein